MDPEPLEPLEVNTEFDRRLAPFRRMIWRRLGAGLAVFLGLEFALIFFILSDHNVLRMQTMNGALVGVGGLVVFTLGALLLVLPAKLIAIESLKQIREAQKIAQDSGREMGRFIERAEPVLKRVEALAETIDKRSEQAALDLKGGSRRIEEGLDKLTGVFSRPIPSVGPAKFVRPAGYPDPGGSGHVESAPAVAAAPAEVGGAEGNGSHPR